MIEKEVFLKMMNLITKQYDKDNAFGAALSECCDRIVYLEMGKNLDAFLLLAKKTIDPDEWISWYFFDTMDHEIEVGDDKIIVDTPEKLYDFLKEEYPIVPKMIKKATFLEILKLQKEQNEASHKLVHAIENYIDCQYAIPSDSYHEALMILIENTFDFGENYAYWLYEGGKSVGVDGAEIDISTPGKLYSFIASEFKAYGGKKPKRIADPNVKTVTLEEMFELMKEQILKKQLGV